ncbi:ferrous iron transport protein A [Caminicella sporogenes DSM 14501]|uniref:Ferrous iron transport protein A n=1 Tax=Caminicella sporogenes DSM 14501 TaxID=1121266 RepID=A0A1M6T4E1_9FIRM|nr:FeoA family protein [Caminicella sporogenes]SHK51780.1 ferrous iron transport protein A [Caminicella sporogenes DSM 14501]
MKKYNKEDKILLSEVSVGSKVKVVTLHSNGLLRRRMMDLGFIPDGIVEVVRKSPLGDPIAYKIQGAQIALREEEAEQIEVEILD